MDEIKPCRKCGATERYKSGACIACRKEGNAQWRKDNLDRYKEYNKEWHQNNAERRKAEQACRLYNINMEDYERLMKTERCQLCGKVETTVTRYGIVRRLSIDHDHVTGRVRGALCHLCNSALGYYERDRPRHDLFDNYLRGKTA